MLHRRRYSARALDTPGDLAHYQSIATTNQVATTRWASMGLCCALALGVARPVYAEIYKYRRPDGTWAFTNDPDAVPLRARSVKVQAARPQDHNPPRDLARHLQQRHEPKNAIERVALAVVMVRSTLGKGSGFFVSSSGLIVTNLHVLEVRRDYKKRRGALIKRLNARIKRTESVLKREQVRLTKRQRRLERYRGRFEPAVYRERLGQLERWERDLAARRRKFLASVEELKELERKDSHRLRVSAMAQTADVILADKTKIKARRVAANEKWDLALLRVEGYRTPTTEPVQPRETPIGAPVYAIGNPASLHSSVARGVLSGYEGGYVKTDAKIYPGNSGGPLVDKQGRVIGVNTFKKLTHKFEGLGFAVPIARAYEVFSSHLPPPQRADAANSFQNRPTEKPRTKAAPPVGEQPPP